MDKREEVISELRKIRDEINPIKSQLDDLHKKKEDAFDKKELLKNQIKELSFELKRIKSQKDRENVGFEETKNIKNKTRDELDKLSERFKALIKKRNDLLQSKNINGNPELVKKKIEALELSIETEGYDYEKEQKVMNQIKNLKNIYDDLKEVVDINKELDKMALAIRDLKSKLKVYNDISGAVKTGQYKEFMVLVKKIGELRKEQENAFNEFIMLKNEFNELNSEFKDKLKASRGVKGKLRDIDKSFRINKRKKDQILIEEKAKKAEDKLRTFKKLTTEDIIALQGRK